MWFPNRFDTNLAVQAQKVARGGNFRFRKKMNGTIYVAKTKGLISCAVTEQLICTFVFAVYAYCWFSLAAAHICVVSLSPKQELVLMNLFV